MYESHKHFIFYNFISQEIQFIYIEMTPPPQGIISIVPNLHWLQRIFTI